MPWDSREAAFSAWAGLRERSLQPEDRKRPVADELVYHAAGAFDGFADHFEIAVEQEDRVIGQAVLGDASEIAQVAEEHRDPPLPTAPVLPGELRLDTETVGIKDGDHADVVGGPELAGEAHIVGSADAGERCAFCCFGHWLAFEALDYPHAARRTAASAAANGNMRYAGGAARLEHAEAKADGGDAPIGITDADTTARRQGAKRQGSADQSCKAAIKGEADILEEGRVGALLQACIGPVAITSMFGMFAPERACAIYETEQREDRHEQSDGIEQCLVTRKPVAPSHPEPGAEAGMTPDEEKGDRLARRVGGARPERPQNGRIVAADTGQERLHSGGDHMGYQQKGQAQAEDDLQGFADRHPQRLAAIEAVERHQEVREQGAIKHDGSGQALPHKREHMPARFHGSDGNEAERMIEKMAEHEHSEHAAGDQVYLFASAGGKNCQTGCLGLPAEARPV